MSKISFVLGSFLALTACALFAAWLRPFDVKMPASFDIILIVAVGKSLLAFEVSSRCKQFWNGILCGMLDSAFSLIAMIAIPIILKMFTDNGRSASAASIAIPSLMVGVIVLPTLVATGLVSLRVRFSKAC